VASSATVTFESLTATDTASAMGSVPVSATVVMSMSESVESAMLAARFKHRAVMHVDLHIGDDHRDGQRDAQRGEVLVGGPQS
jgi:hypothetical protein